MLSRIKRFGDFPWLNEVSCVPLQQYLRHQQAAFKNFFAGRAKSPVFKSKKHRQTAEFTRSAFSHRDGQLYMAKSKTPLNIRWTRPLPSEPSTLTISKDWAGRSLVSYLCGFEPQALPVTPKMIGIDLGLKDLFVTKATGLDGQSCRLTAGIPALSAALVVGIPLSDYRLTCALGFARSA